MKSLFNKYVKCECGKRMNFYGVDGAGRIKFYCEYCYNKGLILLEDLEKYKHGRKKL